jgi:uncharacterized protein YbaP (TraB family)
LIPEAAAAQHWKHIACASILLLAGCRTPERPPALRTSYRTADLPVSATAETKRVPVSLTPVTTPDAAPARRGMDWLLANRNADGIWNAPYPIAVSALALSAGLRDERMADPAFQAIWHEVAQQVARRQNAVGLLSRARPAALPYEHALATRALCEAHRAWPEADAITVAATAAVRYLLDHQQAAGGWHYGYADGRHRSTPLTVVQMDALHAAAQADILRIASQQALTRAAASLVDAQDPRTGAFGYLTRGIGTSVMNGYALYGLQLADQGLSLSARKGWLASAEAETPWPPSLQRPLFPAYYMHQAAYHQGGAVWKQWRTPFYQELLSGQHPDGYWSAPRQEAPLGRAYATALSVLMLRVTEAGPPRLQTTQRAFPGPLYRIGTGTRTVYLLPTTFTEPADAYLLDPLIAPLLHRAERIYIEGSIRQWAHEWGQSIATNTAPNPEPLPAEWVNALNAHFDVPALAGDIWGQTPAWALALAVWGQALEQEARSPDSMVEALIQRRAPPGLRLWPLIDAAVYQASFATLSPAEGRLLLAHALRLAPETGRIADALADAWSQGNENLLRNLTGQLLGHTPDVNALHQRLLTPARDRFMHAIRDALQTEQNAWFLVPSWHLYGEQGIMEQIRREGYPLQNMNTP